LSLTRKLSIDQVDDVSAQLGRDLLDDVRVVILLD
jgi:hypothetical protein